MAIENSLAGLRLSGAVQRVAERYLEWESVAPAQVVKDLLALHPDYGDGLAVTAKLSEELTAGAAPIDDLLRDVLDLYDRQKVSELHTRIAIIGLVLLQPELDAYLGFLLPALASELVEPPEQIFTPKGLTLWRDLDKLRKQEVCTALRALADTPTLAADSLRFGDYADALVEFIENPETGKPLTIGIDAAWGMGKTSLMYMVRERLDPGSIPAAGGGGKHGEQARFSHFRTVWFNAWKYDREEALWAALALEILAQTRKRSTARQRLRTWVALNRERFDWALFLQDTLTAIAKPLFLLLLGAALFIAGAIALKQRPETWLALAAAVGVSGVYGIGTTAFKYVTAPFNLNIGRYVRTPNYAEKIGFLSEFEADFRRVVRAVTQNGKWPLVVFVDDLDRCGPKQAVEVVEAINSVLDTEHCVFVLGMDSQAVAASIEAKYKEMKDLLDFDPGGLTLGERFLEKIIQISFRIPRAEKTVVDGYIGRILAGGAPPAEPEASPGVKAAEQLIKAEQRVGKPLAEAARAVGEKKLAAADVQEAKDRIGERSVAEAEQVRLAVVEAAPYLEFNPRKIKRFINTFRLQALVAQKRGMLTDPAEATLLARALIIATRWPDLVEGLVPNREYVQLLLDAEATQSRLQEAATRMLTTEEDGLKVRLDRALESPRLKRLIGATELIDLLRAIADEERSRLADYLVLARTAAPAAAH